MNWITLTLANGNPTLVDMSKAVYLSKGQLTTIHFNVVLLNTEGKPALKNIKVKEPLDYIQKAVKGRKSVF